MKRIIKKIGKNLIIYFMVSMFLLSTVSYGYTQDEVGAAIAGYAINLVTEYGDQVNYGQIAGTNGYTYDRTWNPIWSPDSYSWDDTTQYGFDCSSFSSGCIHAVTGLLSYPLNTSGLIGLSSDENFEVFKYTGKSCLKPGDVVVHEDGTAHAVVYVGETCSAWDSSGEIANNGSQFRSISYFDNNYNFYVVRVSEYGAANLTHLDTTFSTGATTSNSSSKNLSNFYFNGIPDGKYSVASTNILDFLLEALSNIANYLIGILTYGIRIVIVGWTAAVHQWITNAANAFFYADESSTDTDGISSVEIDSSEYTLTIEDIVYNTYEALDVNIFKND